MSHYEMLYPGRFLKKEALTAPKVIRITAINQTELEGEKGIETKVVMKYKSAGGDGEMVLCKTNAVLIAAVLNTNDYDQWLGHLVTLYNNPSVDLKGKKVGGIRVYGSPEMKAPKRVEIKRPRRKRAEVYDLVITDNQGRDKGGQHQAQEQTASPPPGAFDDVPPPTDMPVFDDGPDIIDGEEVR